MIQGMRSLRLSVMAAGVCLGWAITAQADMVMKVLIVNPSDTEVKEYDIRNPLPPEVTAEHVLETDGLKVEYDSQAGTYVLVGHVTLKPKESLTKRILIQDVWVIDVERLTAFRRETGEIVEKLKGGPYYAQGQIMADAVERRVNDVERAQQESFLSPAQHINRYRESIKQLQMVESDLVSLRQLMVMASLHPTTEPSTLPSLGQAQGALDGVGEKGGLSILATWRIIFIILALLGLVSLSFFFVWQHQLKLQLAKQLAQETAKVTEPAPLLKLGNGNGKPVSDAPTASLPRAQSKTPLAP